MPGVPGNNYCRNYEGNFVKLITIAILLAGLPTTSIKP